MDSCTHLSQTSELYYPQIPLILQGGNLIRHQIHLANLGVTSVEIYVKHPINYWHKRIKEYRHLLKVLNISLALALENLAFCRGLDSKRGVQESKDKLKLQSGQFFSLVKNTLMYKLQVTSYKFLIWLLHFHFPQLGNKCTRFFCLWILSSNLSKH